MIRLLTVFTVLLALAGCTATKPNYSYNAAASDPVLIFRSDFDFHTFFEVNIDPAAKTSCKSFKSVGYTLHVNSILIIGSETNREVRVSVPADQPVSVKAHYNFTAGQGNTSCGPLYASFTPKPSTKYQVRMVKNGEYCEIDIADLSNAAATVQVEHFKTCNK